MAVEILLGIPYQSAGSWSGTWTQGLGVGHSEIGRGIIPYPLRTQGPKCVSADTNAVLRHWDTRGLQQEGPLKVNDPPLHHGTGEERGLGRAGKTGFEAWLCHALLEGPQWAMSLSLSFCLPTTFY